MEPSDAAEAISELGEGEKEKSAENRFRGRAALVIAVMAMLLAITSLGGGNVAEDIVANNIQAGNLWSFYQAKNARQTSYKLAADELGTEIQLHQGSMTPELRRSLEAKIKQYEETVARYESEPDKGEGKKELSERARSFEAERDRALKQDTSFDLAEALFQIAIVLASVAILSSSRMILRLAVVLGAAAAVLMLNGFFMLFTLPL
ncbi:MAG TPA: DUF4337 domain-containing protein [Pyrinomonadaceae bacterium]|nr:DUF4337 domain-containing protein [Pyrinomonadaceae bacterium]